MKILLNKLLIIILILFCSCQKDKGIPITSFENSVDEFKERALERGDTGAYYQLSLDYMDSPYDGFLYTSLLMANKYGYPQAYIDVYYCLTDKMHKKEYTELDDLDESTRSLALKYLKNGAEKGNKECLRIIGYYYVEGKYLPKDVAKGNEYIRYAE